MIEVITLSHTRYLGFELPAFKTLRTGIHDDFWLVVEDGECLAVCTDKVKADRIKEALNVHSNSLQA